MKTKKFLGVILVIILMTSMFSLNIENNASAASSKSDINFIHTVGGSANDGVVDMAQTEDYGYIVSGWTQSYGGTDQDIMLTKYDAAGEVEWLKTVGGTFSDIGSGVIQISDGGYVLTGYTASYGAIPGTYDFILMKFNSMGVEQWTKTIDASSGTDYAYDVLETSDGGFVISGHTTGYGVAGFDVILIKFNSSGVEQWTKTLGGANNEEAWDLVSTNDDGFAICGFSTTFGGTDEDILLSKFDSDGVEQWTKTVGGSSNDRAWSCVQTNDGGFALTGASNSYGGSDSDIILVKFTSSGVEEWTKTVGGGSDDVGRSVDQMADGSYILTGSTKSYGGSDDDVILIKFNSSGVEQWTQVIGNTGDDYSYFVEETYTGSIVMAGQTRSYGGADIDNLLIRVDENGTCQGCAEIIAETVTEQDETVTESDETVTEVNQTDTEVDENITESSESVTEEVTCTYNPHQVGIGVDVSEVVSLNCGTDVDFGTITPGTPTSASTTCEVTTNAENGYTLQVRRDDPDTTMDHTLDNATNIDDKTEWTGTGGTTETWTGTGLGFAVYTSTTGSKNTTDWGAGTACHDALNEYTGFPSSYQEVLTHSSYSSTSTTTGICYRVDIPSTQKSGAYDGTITYQVYTNP